LYGFKAFGLVEDISANASHIFLLFIFFNLGRYLSKGNLFFFINILIF